MNNSINLHPYEYTQTLKDYVTINLRLYLDRCFRSCNTINDLSNKVCFPSKTEDLNLSVFSMITGMNELKTLTKHISCECKCKFDGRKCNANQNRITINADVSVYICNVYIVLYLESYIHVVAKMVNI